MDEASKAPVADKAPADQPIDAPLAAPGAPPAAPVVLLVDDEPAILSALRRLLRPQGYRVLMAESGSVALALLAAEPVNLVVSDMRMPEMDGVQFLEQVRARWPGVVRVLLTGYADISATIGAINRGEIHRYLCKPWEDQDLLLALSDGLKRQQLERENMRLAQLTQQQNLQLQAANQALAQGKAALEQRVQARTQDLELAHRQIQAAHAQLEENFALSISVFSGLLELRHGSVAGHGHRVATLARRVAKKLELGENEELDIYNAGLLHEVGKIGLPDALFNKPVALMDGREFNLYKQHPVMAQAALTPLGRLRQTAVIIRAQNERVDGRGYPSGLAGFEVPLGAQIINIASTYQALITGRQSERELSTSEALASVLKGTGTRYDPDVSKAFEAVVQEIALEVNADQALSSGGLQPGMILSRPLLSPQGSVLLPVDFCFTSGLIKQIKELESRDSLSLRFFVKLPPAPGTAECPSATAARPGGSQAPHV